MTTTTATRDDRCTPESVLTIVRRFSSIAIDPCPNQWSTVGASTELDDGLETAWTCRRDGRARTLPLAWVNPPWSALWPWAAKTRIEFELGHCEILFWAPCSPETAWADLLWEQASRIAFAKWRPHHPLPGEPRGARGASKYPCMMFYLGARVTRFDRVFGSKFYVTERRRRR